MWLTESFITKGGTERETKKSQRSLLSHVTIYILMLTVVAITTNKAICLNILPAR